MTTITRHAIERCFERTISVEEVMEFCEKENERKRKSNWNGKIVSENFIAFVDVRDGDMEIRTVIPKSWRKRWNDKGRRQH